MPNLKQLKNQINAINKTEQITKAMYSISSSKIKKSEEALLSFQNFSNEFYKIFNIIKNKIIYKNKENLITTKKIYIIISSDRGLIGSFHNQLFKFLKEKINDIDFNNNYFFTIGRKSYLFCKKNKFNLINNKPLLNKDDLSLIELNEATLFFKKLYENESISEIKIIYNKSISKNEYKPVIDQIFPLFETYLNNSDHFDTSEISDDIINDILKTYLEVKTYSALLSSKKSEHSARMFAMKNASDNANKIISKLHLKYHRLRQQTITSEIIDIVSGTKGN